MTSENTLPEQSSTSYLSSNSDDYSDLIGSWLRSCLELAESSSNELILSKFKELDTYRRWRSFRLAVVGEQNRGKSTFINRLLGKSILPANIYRTTGNVTSIIAGSEEGMEVCFGDGKRETRILEASSWDDLLATSPAGEDQNLFIADIQATVNNSWLEEIDIEIIDTPSSEGMSSRQTALISKLLGQCDATVLVIGADMPFGTTEAAFLEEEVIGQHIPRILVIVSKLDTVPEESRNRLVKLVEQRVAKISDKVSVLPLHPINSDMTQNEVFEEVRTKIEELVGKENRRAWRSQKIALQIADFLSQLMKIGDDTISTLAISEKERAKALQDINLEIGQANLNWESIKLELEKRRMQHSQKLKKEIDAAKVEFLNSFTNELNREEDIKLWWENTLPVSLQSRIVVLDRKTEKFIISNLNRDSQWLEREVKQVFNVEMVSESVTYLEESEISLDLKNIELNDTKQQVFWEKASNFTPRVIEILGTGLIAPVVWVANPPLAVAIAVSSVALGEGTGMILNLPAEMITNEQRKIVAIELEKILETIFSAYYKNVDEQFRKLYNRLLKKTQEQQNKWISTKKYLLRNKDNCEVNKQLWKKIISDARALRSNIITTIEK